MSNILVVLGETKSQDFPAGTVVKGYTASLNGATPVDMDLVDGKTQVLFTDVSAGLNTVIVSLVDSNGVVLGEATGGDIIVPEPVVLVAGQVPATIVLTLQ